MPRIPLAQAVDEYLSWLELDRHAAEGTIAEYRRDLEAFTEFADNADVRSIARLARDVLRAYQRRLARLRTGPEGSRRPLAVSTRARQLVALRSFLRFCAREEWLPGDLGATIDVPRSPSGCPSPSTPATVTCSLEVLPTGTLEELRDRALILFLLSTGCRISEPLRLDVEDWNPRHLRVIGKGDRERTVIVTDRARQAVEEYLAARDDPSPALFISFHPKDCGKRENRLTADGARHVCRELIRRLGIPAFWPTSCGTRWGPSSK